MGGGNLKGRYARGAGADEPIWRSKSRVTSSLRWLMADNQGSIIADFLDVGAATAHGYGPFGEPDATKGWSRAA